MVPKQLSDRNCPMGMWVVIALGGEDLAGISWLRKGRFGWEHFCRCIIRAGRFRVVDNEV